MEGKKAIKFQLLGSFSCRDEENKKIKNNTVPEGAGKKALSFLQYLIVNHGRNISSEELIERFWPEENSSNPANALRTMLFKVRKLLKEMFPGRKELLLTLPGGYAWSQEVPIELDTEEFEAACLKAGKKTDEEYGKLLEKAVSIYQGDFLAANDSDWAKVLRQYYQALYLDACKKFLPLLEKREEWVNMIRICEQAGRVDFTMEEFTAYQMRALIALGQPEQAAEKYEVFRERLLRELEMTPSGYMEQLYILASGLRKNDLGVQDIFRLICEGEREQKAFLCTFETFQSVAMLEKRHLARSGQTSALAMVSLSDRTASAADARRLERILLEGLREGDPVARLEVGSYILLLTGADEEDARAVMARLEGDFRRTYRHSRARLTWQVARLNEKTGKP